MEKVLVIADFNDTGGTGTYLRRILEYLDSRYSVHIVLHKKQMLTELFQYIRSTGFSYSVDYSMFPLLERFLMRVFRRLRLFLFYALLRDTLVRLRLEHKYKPDLFFISQGGGCGYFPFLFSKRPVFLIMHSLFLDSIFKNYLGRLYIDLYKNIGEKKTICSVSKSACELFEKNIHSHSIASRLICIPNYATKPEDFEKNPKGKINILTIGHLVQYKNPSTWMNVAILVTAKYKGEVEFVWVGNGELFAKMKALAKENSSINILDFQKNIDELYRNADIYFQPSLWESQGIAVIEAMAYAIPCVVSNAGGLVDSVENKKEGFVCDVYATNDYVDAISTLVKNKQTRIDFGENARLKFEKVFSKEIWEKNMTSIISELLFINKPHKRKNHAI